MDFTYKLTTVSKFTSRRMGCVIDGLTGCSGSVASTCITCVRVLGMYHCPLQVHSEGRIVVGSLLVDNVVLDSWLDA
jgi:hypothetical protein